LAVALISAVAPAFVPCVCTVSHINPPFFIETNDKLSATDLENKNVLADDGNIDFNNEYSAGLHPAWWDYSRSASLRPVCASCRGQVKNRNAPAPEQRGVRKNRFPRPKAAVNTPALQTLRAVRKTPGSREAFGVRASLAPLFRRQARSF